MRSFSIKKSWLITLSFFIVLVIACFSCTKIDNGNAIGTGDLSSAMADPERPNIIMILIDDVGYEIPQYTGGQSYSTPAMNRLASLGMQFTHCYASAMCTPSRVSLLTGKYGFRNYKEWGIMDTTQKTIANILKDHGYKTCVSGKWQLSGGDAAIHKFGFDTYSVFDPFEERDIPDEEENKYRYKNPHIYQGDAYVPDADMQGKYSDDVFVRYAAEFMKRNQTNPFFIYFSFSECHKPFSPSPSNPDYAAWQPLSDTPNKKYFPDMVSYMDSKISNIVNAVNGLSLQSNTYIFVFADNGTPPDIVSKYNGRAIRGGKTFTNEFGVHVPLIVIGPSIQPNSVCRNIVDFTDFMPTIASLAKVPKEDWPNYGIMDGQTFHTQLLGTGTTTRTSSYTYYFPNSRLPLLNRIYVQDTTYKLYDITNNNNFYNLQIDSLEQFPIPDTLLTARERAIKRGFQSILARMHN